MRQLTTMLSEISSQLGSSSAKRVSLVWQDRDLVYRWAHNAPPELGSDYEGKKLEDFGFDTPDMEAYRTIKLDALSSGKRHNYVYKTRIGDRWHTYDLSTEVTRGEDGEIDGLMTTSIDITDLIEAHASLEVANQRLLKILDEGLRV